MGTPKKSAAVSNRDAKIEGLLDTHGLTYRYVQVVPLEEIERHADAQSRLGNIDKKRVNTYVEAMKNGANFPPVVLWDDPTDGYSIVDGNTRVEARRRRKEHSTDAYLVDITSRAQAIVISAIFNGVSGQPLTAEEKKRAVLMNADLGALALANATLARDYGLSEARVGQIVTVKRLTEDLGSLGVAVDQIPETTIYAMRGLTEAAVKRDLAALAIDADLSAKDVRALAKEVQTKTSEADRLAHIVAARQDNNPAILARAAGRVAANAPTTQAAMIYGSMAKLMADNPDPAKWVPVNPVRFADQYAKVQEIHPFLGSLLEEFAKAKAAQETAAAAQTAVA